MPTGNLSTTDTAVTSRPTGPNTEQAATARQGSLDHRRVSTQSGGAVASVRESADSATVATPASARTVSLANAPVKALDWFADQLNGGEGVRQCCFEQLALEGRPSGEALKNDVKTVVDFARAIDKDIGRAAKLLAKSDEEPLNARNQEEVNTLLRAGKYNLEQVQRWASVVRDGCQGQPHELEFMAKLQERLADRHMDLADMMCLFDIDQAPPEDQAVSRADRIDYHLTAADAALKVADGLSVKGLPEDKKQELVDILQDHRAELGQAKEVATGRSSGSDEKSQVVSKEVWRTSFNLTKGKKAGDVTAALHKRWDAKAAGAPGEWLPLAHPEITQERMLQEFVGYRLKRAGVAKKDMPDLRFQFKEAANQVRNERPWEPIEKQLNYAVDGISHRVQSTITPAGAMADRFAEPYPANGNGVCCSDRMQYTHVPNLARTELTDASGATLFSALRHGVLDAYDISVATLRKLPEQELTTMVADLLDGSDETVKAIRTDKSAAEKLASDMRTAASTKMAEELAVAALVSDPDKLQAALDGKVVDLNLSSISLLTPDRVRPLSSSPKSNEREMLRRQTEALQSLSGEQKNLQVRDASGDLRTVVVNCKVRTFNFGVNEGAVSKPLHMIPQDTPGWGKLMGWSYAMERNNPELKALLGKREGALGGEVKTKLAELADKKAQLQSALDVRISLVTSELRSGNRDDDQAREQKYKIKLPRQVKRPLRADIVARLTAAVGQLEGELAATQQRMNTLKEAATEAKTIWHEGSYNKGGQDPYKMVSRLGVVINAMGETLAFNCKSGKDRTGQLDAELKYLSALSAGESQSLPEPGAPATPELRQMRSDFTLGTGNLEMQRLNTGLAGFKLDTKEVPGLANYIAGPEMEAMYRGGSNYVKG